MSKRTTESIVKSSPEWGELEGWLRGRRHQRTTNVVESPFAALRLRPDAAKRFKRVDRVISVIWKILMVAESRFRRLKATELMKDVYLGTVYEDGIVIKPTPEKVAT